MTLCNKSLGCFKRAAFKIPNNKGFFKGLLGLLYFIGHLSNRLLFIFQVILISYLYLFYFIYLPKKKLPLQNTKLMQHKRREQCVTKFIDVLKLISRS